MSATIKTKVETLFVQKMKICPLCDYKTRDKPNFNKHLRRHFCGSASGRQMLTLNHELCCRIHPRKRHFDNKRQLRLHLNIAHSHLTVEQLRFFGMTRDHICNLPKKLKDANKAFMNEVLLTLNNYDADK